MAWATADGSICREDWLEGGWGIIVSGWGGGCLACSASKVGWVKGANLSSELANLTAPLKSPSSSLEVTLLPSNLSTWLIPAFFLLRLAFGGTGSASSRIWDLNLLVSDL